MATEYRPNDKEATALPKTIAHIPFVDMGHIFTAHIPVIDLPEHLLKILPDGEEWRGVDVQLMNQMVVFCLN